MKNKTAAQEINTLTSANENSKMFNKIAKNYDIMNKLISLGRDKLWRKEAIKALNIEVGNKKYLDIGCGTGDLSIEIAKKSNSASVLGIDLSEEMIKIAKKKNKYPNISFSLGDATTLAFSNNLFDGIITGFCIRNVVDRKKALKEMHRVLKTGARCVILELNVPRHFPFNIGYCVYTSFFIPFIASILSERSAYTYLNKSIQNFPSPESFIEMIKNAEFRNVSARAITFGVVNIYTAIK